MAISIEMLNVIEKTADTAVIKFAKMNNVQDINYYKKTERLLYAYPALKEIIKSTYVDIEDFINQGVQFRSKDIVKMPKANEGIRKDLDDVLLERIESKRDNLKRTEFDVAWIEKALEKLSEDEMFLISMKYFNNMSMLDIADKIHCSESTVKRLRRRAITNTSINLFGSVVFII